MALPSLALPASNMGLGCTADVPGTNPWHSSRLIIAKVDASSQTEDAAKVYANSI